MNLSKSTNRLERANGKNFGDDADPFENPPQRLSLLMRASHEMQVALLLPRYS
jgi:hypothetical protein